MRQLLFLAAAGLSIALFAFAAPKPADTSAADRTAAQKCLTSKDARGCIGKIAKTCLAAPGGETTIGMMECTGRERAVWDEQLNASYKLLQGKATPTQAGALKQAQQAWIAYRDARCGFEASRYEGGTLAGVIAGNCLMQVTAERAVELTAQARDWDQP
jgi:uncharacterized protein YecT (DUF1311 family)